MSKKILHAKQKKPFKNPYYAGSFRYGRPRKGHGWTPYDRNAGELDRQMAEHITKNAREEENTKQ